MMNVGWAGLGGEKGEIEIKELWFSAFFYRTQVAFRGEVPKEIVEDYLANLV